MRAEDAQVGGANARRGRAAHLPHGAFPRGQVEVPPKAHVVQRDVTQGGAAVGARKVRSDGRLVGAWPALLGGAR
eukprot:scaffold16402_cov48-Phaeocystis_antarctica.AAC.2